MLLSFWKKNLSEIWKVKVKRFQDMITVVKQKISQALSVNKWFKKAVSLMTPSNSSNRIIKSGLACSGVNWAAICFKKWFRKQLNKVKLRKETISISVSVPFTHFKNHRSSMYKKTLQFSRFLVHDLQKCQWSAPFRKFHLSKTINPRVKSKNIQFFQYNSYWKQPYPTSTTMLDKAKTAAYLYLFSFNTNPLKKLLVPNTITAGSQLNPEKHVPKSMYSLNFHFANSL